MTKIAVRRSEIASAQGRWTYWYSIKDSDGRRLSGRRRNTSKWHLLKESENQVKDHYGMAVAGAYGTTLREATVQSIMSECGRMVQIPSCLRKWEL